MQFNPNNLYHVYNQGNNQQVIFHNDNDCITFLNLYRNAVAPYAETITWCLMPNHFHFMLMADERCNEKIKQGGIIIDPVTNGFRKLLSGYARIFNASNARSGSLFRQKTKGKCLSEQKQVNSPLDINDYLFNCFHYIHQNPLKAGLVQRLEDWEYSSFKDYAGLRNGALINKSLAVEFCGYNPLTFIKESYNIISDDF